MALKRMRAKYQGKCVECGNRIQIGDEIYWDTATRKTRHVRCPGQAVKSEHQEDAPSGVTPGQPRVSPEGAMFRGYVLERTSVTPEGRTLNCSASFSSSTAPTWTSASTAS